MMLKDVPMERKTPIAGEESGMNAFKRSFEYEMDRYLVDKR